jgi:hypothetical protein
MPDACPRRYTVARAELGSRSPAVSPAPSYALVTFCPRCENLKDAEQGIASNAIQRGLVESKVFAWRGWIQSLIFVFCLWKAINLMNPLHDRSVNGFFDLLVRRIFRVLVRSGNAISTALLDAVVQYY